MDAKMDEFRRVTCISVLLAPPALSKHLYASSATLLSVHKVLAHHEAGHAVAMVKLGIPIDRMTLEEFEEGGLGGVKPVAGGCSDYYKHAVAYLAGPRAGYRYIDSAENSSSDLETTFDNDRLYNDFGSASDLDRAEKCVQEVGRVYAEAEAAADKLIEDNWIAVEAVAAEFAKKAILNGAEVVAIVNRFEPSS